MEDIEIIKKYIDEATRIYAEDIYNKEFIAIKNMFEKMETLKVFIAGKKKDVKKYSSSVIHKVSVINLLEQIEEILGE